jgi:diamine N-acetyltransferase
MVSLRPIDESNRAEVEALRVAPAQRQFVSTVTDSLREAAEYPSVQIFAWGVYDGEEPVGFAMIADDVGDNPDYIPQFIWKLLIDERYQGRGYGRAVLDLVVAYFRGRPGVTVVTVSAGEGEGSPIPFYERYGFARTGEMHGDEVLLTLDIASG